MHLFNTGSDGSLSAKTFEERSKETVDAINTMAGNVDEKFEPLMKGAAATPFVLVGGTLAVNEGRAAYAYAQANAPQMYVAARFSVQVAASVSAGKPIGGVTEIHGNGRELGEYFGQVSFFELYNV